MDEVNWRNESVYHPLQLLNDNAVGGEKRDHPLLYLRFVEESPQYAHATEQYPFITHNPGQIIRERIRLEIITETRDQVSMGVETETSSQFQYSISSSVWDEFRRVHIEF